VRARKVLLVFRKDWREIRRNWQVMTPILIVPLLFTVAIPAAVILLPGLMNVPTSTTAFLELMVENLPGNIKSQLLGMAEDQVMIFVMLLYFFAPFFLIIPVMASSVIASDSFAGEKERKTTVDLLTYEMFGRLLLPNWEWVLLIFGLAPAVALAGIGLTVMISARVKGFREAQQISAVLVVPILVMLFAQASGVMIFGYVMVGALTLVFVLVDVLLFRLGVRVFQRDKILSQGS
jgi:ABC-type Na+ efflux pump permease subunit